MYIELANCVDEVPTVVSALQQFSAREGLDQAVVQAAELALDEWLTNIISYGYRDTHEHSIRVEFIIEHKALKLVVSDDGVAFNPFDVAVPDLSSPLEDRKVGGMGIFLVTEFMDEHCYLRSEGRNVLTLRKSLEPG
jgi:anti-sigma regulatory factor (Ser/Thr protein kinase)